jgi:hypothetical protein
MKRLTINGNGVRSKSPDGILVNLASSDNIVFEDNIVESTSGTFPWEAETTDETALDASIAPGKYHVANGIDRRR